MSNLTNQFNSIISQTKEEMYTKEIDPKERWFTIITEKWTIRAYDYSDMPYEFLYQIHSNHMTVDKKINREATEINLQDLLSNNLL